MGGSGDGALPNTGLCEKVSVITCMLRTGFTAVCASSQVPNSPILSMYELSGCNSWLDEYPDVFCVHTEFGNPHCNCEGD